mgnify:CR=1 FL=1|jgi:predicted Zn-dependent protease
MRTKKILAFLFAIAFLIACSRVPITNRKQVNLLPESEMIGMAMTSYNEFLAANPPVPSSNAEAQMVQKLGQNIATAVESYMTEHGKQKRIAGFEWEFKLVNDPMVNAWCMPGGKVVVYAGILNVAETEAGLAVVMGHEIAHAIARHGNERMSQQLVIQMGGITLATLLQEKPEAAQNIFLSSYGIGTGLGALSFSRQHESEADKMGLIFMSMAGYDPREAPKFWERMSTEGGAEPPEFLSTHPNHETRVNDLNEFMPEALKYYNPVQN